MLLLISIVRTVFRYFMISKNDTTINSIAFFAVFTRNFFVTAN